MSLYSFLLSLKFGSGGWVKVREIRYGRGDREGNWGCVG